MTEFSFESRGAFLASLQPLSSEQREELSSETTCTICREEYASPHQNTTGDAPTTDSTTDRPIDTAEGEAVVGQIQHEQAVSLPCGHVFGRDCLTSWIEGSNNTCPICRRPLFPSRLHPPLSSAFIRRIVDAVSGVHRETFGTPDMTPVPNTEFMIDIHRVNSNSSNPLALHVVVTTFVLDPNRDRCIGFGTCLELPDDESSDSVLASWAATRYQQNVERAFNRAREQNNWWGCICS